MTNIICCDKDIDSPLAEDTYNVKKIAPYYTPLRATILEIKPKK